ncbi:hypothetical protein LEN26_010305 [Aphanomyces euteiches]|nr:hypothetical protein LEN26_010305 [Aphanomyces euteiches]
MVEEYYTRLQHGDAVVIGLAAGALAVVVLMVFGLVKLGQRFRYHSMETTSSSPDNKVADEAEEEEESKEEESDKEEIELGTKKAGDELVLDEPDTTTNLKPKMKLDTPSVNRKPKFTID